MQTLFVWKRQLYGEQKPNYTHTPIYTLIVLLGLKLFPVIGGFGLSLISIVVEFEPNISIYDSTKAFTYSQVQVIIYHFLNQNIPDAVNFL